MADLFDQPLDSRALGDEGLVRRHTEERETLPPMFDGADYAPDRDDARLSSQLVDIQSLMRDGEWRSLNAIAQTTGHPEASISAQLRHLRKPRFGGHVVNRRHVGGGLYEYQLVVARAEVPR